MGDRALRVAKNHSYILTFFRIFSLFIFSAGTSGESLAKRGGGQTSEKFSLFPDKSPPRFPLEEDKTFFTTIAFGTGLGQFQDIQVPIDPQLGTRIDGRPVSKENTDHMGMPLFLSGESVYQSRVESQRNSDSISWSIIRGSILTMKAGSGPDDTINSSYSRFTIGTALGFGTGGIGFGTVRTHWSAILDYRRSTFGNISSAHFIESPMTTLQADMSWRTFALLINSGVGIQPKFGFSQELFWGGKELPSSRASIQSTELCASWIVSQNSTFDLGFDYEGAAVTVSDAGDYADFNLSTDGLTAPRAYQLGTWISKIGFQHYF